MYDFFIQYIVPVLGTAIGSVLLYLIKWLFDRFKISEQYNGLYEAIEVGVHKVEEEYIAQIKRSSGDGKLTPEERQEAMMRAWDVAKNYATDPKIKSALEQLTQDQINSLVKKVLGTTK